MSQALIAIGLIAALSGVLVRTSAPKVAAMMLVAVGTGLVVIGGLRLTGDATAADWLVAIPGAIVGALFHVMVVLGPFGPAETPVG